MYGNKVEGVLVERNLDQHAAILLKAEFIKLFHERLKAGWDDGAEHAIHLAIPDLADGGRIFWLIERIVFLEYHFAAIGLDRLASVFVEQLGPDIVRRRHGEALLADCLDQIRDQLVALLRRRGAGAEQVLRALLALVELRIDVESTAPVDDRVLDGLAHRAGDAAQHRVDLALLDQPAHVAHGYLWVRSGICEIEFDRLTEDTAALVDFLNRELSHLPVGVAGRCDRAGDISRDTHLDWAGGMAPT